jgi:hypothetical protein
MTSPQVPRTLMTGCTPLAEAGAPTAVRLLMMNSQATNRRTLPRTNPGGEMGEPVATGMTAEGGAIPTNMAELLSSSGNDHNCGITDYPHVGNLLRKSGCNKAKEEGCRVVRLAGQKISAAVKEKMRKLGHRPGSYHNAVEDQWPWPRRSLMQAHPYPSWLSNIKALKLVKAVAGPEKVILVCALNLQA